MAIYQSHLSVRQACIEDAKAIILVSSALGYEEKTDQTLAVKRLERLLESDHDRIWVAELKGGVELNDKVIGWLHAQHAFRVASADFIEILGLSVSSDVRLQGAGHALVEQAKNWALDESIALRVRTNETRDSAKKFYSSLGFSLIKKQSVFQILS